MRPLCFSLSVICLPGSVLAAIDGTVSTSTGRPIEHARVEIVGGPEMAFTDGQGRFEFGAARPPLELRVSHPRFLSQTVSVAEESSLLLEIRLEPKQEIYEEIAVSANRGEENFAPVSVATSVIDPGESAAPASTVTEMVAELPAVAENGQGGIFQTFSIRGVSRQRVLTLISGMRVVGERRAGVSASFIDPRLLGTTDVLRGPSSTYYGSGALGGVVQLFPRHFDTLAVEAGYGYQGDEVYQLLGWGDDNWSLGLARRRASASEAPDGTTLHSGFTQTSGSLARRWSKGTLRYEIQALGSIGEDIGKANTDFPERRTTYPEEEHGLLRFAVRSDSRWLVEAWAHPNSLQTRVEESDRLTEVENEALDYGFNWQRQIRVAGLVATRFGVDYFGRRNVEAVETSTDRLSGLFDRQTNFADGEEDEAGLYGTAEWVWGQAAVLAGARYTWSRQRIAGRSSADDTALTGFVGMVLPLGGGFELASNLGSGLRFPSLSERFFTGITGRGEVIGNPALEPERSLNADVGLRWYGHKLFVSGYLFRNEIDDYIERIETAPDLLTFVNLTEGTIEGLELDGLYQIDTRWSLGFGGHLLEGRENDGLPLADIPADRLFLSGKWRRGRWAAVARWEERSAKTDPGSGEKPIPSASLVSTSIDYSFENGLALSLSGRNLLDKEYFNSADDKVPLAAGRSIGLTVRWRRH